MHLGWAREAAWERRSADWLPASVARVHAAMRPRCKLCVLMLADGDGVARVHQADCQKMRTHLCHMQIGLIANGHCQLIASSWWHLLGC